MGQFMLSRDATRMTFRSLWAQHYGKHVSMGTKSVLDATTRSLVVQVSWLLHPAVPSEGLDEELEHQIAKRRTP